MPFARIVTQRRPEMIAALCGVICYVILAGAETLSPTNLDWLGTGDRAQHLMGWLFFRLSHWTLPVGHIEGFAWPVGTTIGFTDANPLLAILLKPFSPLLPTSFQYIGLWLAACFALQGWFGARIAALGDDRPAYRVLGGILLVLAPCLLRRLGHATLCAQFGLLILLFFHLAPATDTAGARRALRAAAVTTWLFSAVHPYLAMMILGLSLALVVRFWRAERSIDGRAAVKAVSLLVFGQAAIFAILGYFTSAPSHGQGFGDFSSDLLTFVNPMNMGRLLPALPASVEQADGSVYLGLGTGLLTLIAGLLAIGRRAQRTGGPKGLLLPAWLFALLCFLLALSWHVTVAGRTLVDLRSVIPWAKSIFGPFRASGRFAWVAFYLLVGLTITRLPRLVGRPRLATAIVALAALTQAVDLSKMPEQMHAVSRPWRLSGPGWDLLRGPYLHLAMVPAQIVGTGTFGACPSPSWKENEAWVPLSDRAYVYGLTFNSGYLSRAPRARHRRACQEEKTAIDIGQFDPRTVYIVAPEEISRFAVHPDRVTCGSLDGYTACVASPAGDPLRELLSRSPVPGAD